MPKAGKSTSIMLFRYYTSQLWSPVHQKQLGNKSAALGPFKLEQQARAKGIVRVAATRSVDTGFTGSRKINSNPRQLKSGTTKYI